MAHMRPTTPLQSKIPYEPSSEPLKGSLTALGGTAVTSWLFRRMSLPGSCDANLDFLRKISLGYTAGQMVESITSGLLLGIDCVEDMDMMRDDEALEKILGYKVPSTRCVRDWLDKFHDPDLVLAARDRASELNLKASVPDPSAGLRALQNVLGTSARQAASRHPGGIPKSATLDSDGTIIESHKAEAKKAYEGTIGYQPLTTLWAEADVIVSTEFRDGNVPGAMDPLTCIKQGFSEIPKSVSDLAFRGDSANDNNELLDWLDNPCREGGPQGVKIKYAISARMVNELVDATKRVADEQWVTVNTYNDGTLRQWAELDYVPSMSTERKDAQPRRYIGIRILKKQGELFNDGHDRKHFAVVTNRKEAGNLVIDWHREKAGTIEHTQSEMKTALAGARPPSNRFGANAAWFMLNAIAYNMASALRAATSELDMKKAHIKKLRFRYLTITARITRFSRKMTLRFAACQNRIKALLASLKAFPCRIQPTG